MGTVPKYIRLQNDGTLTLKENSDYFLQIQGQLEVGDKPFSYFIVYYRLEDVVVEMFVQKIERDKDFWKQKMLPKLISFYHGCKMINLIERRNQNNLLDWENWKVDDITINLYSTQFVELNPSLFLEELITIDAPTSQCLI